MIFITPLLGFSQKGILRGQVIDGETGEPLFSANAVLKGTMMGSTTDFDGMFELSADPGTYNLEVTFIGMAGITITGIEIKSGDVTVIDAITLKPAANELGEVTITAEAARNTEVALLTVKKKSVNVLDGISSAKLKKTGDSDAGDAVKRVTGVSVEGGKYVYVRGLGDRYTKTMVNGVDVPGLDPDRNAIQIDIFPTNLIGNMTVLKSGNPSLPADYTGGVVDLETKAFPDKKVASISVGIGYNPAMHFNPDYLTYEGSPTDFLGFDNGTRELPSAATESPIPTPSNSTDAEVNDFVNSFDPTLGATQQTSFMNYDLGVSLGNQKALENGDKLGYIFNLTYKNNTEYYDEVTYGEFYRQQDSTEYENVQATLQTGSQGKSTVLVGGLAGIAYKTLTSKYRLTLMHLQNGESVAARLNVNNADGVVGQSGYQAKTTNLVYSQRGLTNILLEGEHHPADGKWDLEWKLSPTFSKIDEPDLRRTPFTIEQGDYVFAPGQGGNPTRIWRTLDEVNTVEKIDITRNLTLNDRESKIRFGASHIYKRRDYEILAYDLISDAPGAVYDGDPNHVLVDSNIYPAGELYYRSLNSPNGEPNPNAYSSNVNNFGGYAAFEVSPFYRLKAVFGLRGEYYVQRHTGRDQEGARNPSSGNVLNDQKVLEAFDLFPSLNLIFSASEDQNIRLNYFRSIARPSFKELSFAQILDPITNRTFNGGLLQYNDTANNNVWAGELTSTRVHNIDVRWEIFADNGGLISASAFAKFFQDPIEIVRIPTAQTTPEFQPRNVGNGEVYGLEFELRKDLAFLSPSLSKVSFNTNITYVYSKINMTDVEYTFRKEYEKEGETIDRTRAMAGQAPYVVNAGLQYDDSEKKFNAGIYYNVKGPTLEIVGAGIFPDVYTQPFHSINITGSKSFGKDSRSTLSLKVSNPLMDVRESFYLGYKAQDQIFSQYSPGMQISLGYSFDLN